MVGQLTALLIANCMLLSVRCCFASQLPVGIATALSNREQHFSHCTFQWSLSSKTTISLGNVTVAQMRKTARLGLISRYKKQGITSQEQVDRMLQQDLREVDAYQKPILIHSIDDYRFVRDGNKTSVSGTRAEIGYGAKYLQLYEGSNGLVVNNGIVSSGTKPPLQMPVVWNSPGDATRYISPFQVSLGVMPEHFASLIGLNPLRMYGAVWQEVSEDATFAVVQSQIDNTALGPLHIQITLNKNYGYAPTLIEVSGVGQPWSKVFAMQHYIISHGYWISDVVEVTDNEPSIKTTHESWMLKQVDYTSQPEVIASQPVADYRLLGSDLSTSDVSQGTTQRMSNNVVYYAWTGNFPSIEQLKALYNKQHPGEASPDPKKTSSLPFIGGLMMLVGGVWMFRRRGGSSS